MKKNKITLLSLTLISSILLFSCASNKTVNEVNADSYGDEETTTLTSTKTKTEKNKTTAPNPQDNIYKRTYTDKLKDIFTFGNKNDFMKIDKTSLFTTTITQSIKQQEATIFVSTREELTGFGSTYMTAYYMFLMNAESRAKLASAYKAYLSDFDNKRLNRKDKKSYKQYGKFPVTLNWGTLESSTPNFGSGNAYLGYEFKKNSPYFTITNYSFENDYYKVVGDATTRESLSLKYYFTKAQMADLLSCISEESIEKAYNEYYEQHGFTINLAEDDEYITDSSDSVEEIEE